MNIGDQKYKLSQKQVIVIFSMIQILQKMRSENRYILTASNGRVYNITALKEELRNIITASSYTKASQRELNIIREKLLPEIKKYLRKRKST